MVVRSDWERIQRHRNEPATNDKGEPVTDEVAVSESRSHGPTVIRKHPPIKALRRCGLSPGDDTILARESAEGDACYGRECSRVTEGRE